MPTKRSARASFAACALGAALAAGCGRSEGPVEAYRSWLGRMADAEYSEAYLGIAAASRAKFEAGAAAAARGATTPLLEKAGARALGAATGEALFRACAAGPGPAFAPPLTREAAERVEVRAVDVGADSATLAVATPNGRRDVRMVREDGAWRIVFEPD